MLLIDSSEFGQTGKITKNFIAEIEIIFRQYKSNEPGVITEFKCVI